ncbi:MAG: NmrA family NAD(P)-binding protein [Neisseriaceae bacterium]|nr:NmrA family NAD(P)-binding protein [Neisseriaceae bacterium]
MYVILGSTGNIGKNVINILTRKSLDYIGITRNESFQDNANYRVFDFIKEPQKLSELLQEAKGVFVLNPPANTKGDFDEQERISIDAIIKGISNTHVSKIIAVSTYGATPYPLCGDLSSLYYLEKQLRKTNIPTVIVRSAYHMNNWLSAIRNKKDSFTLTTLFDTDLKIPMIAPEDLAEICANHLISDNSINQTIFAEAPERYSPLEVLQNLSSFLNTVGKLLVIPENEWPIFYRQLGFSETAIKSFCNMTKITQNQEYKLPEHPYKGKITLATFINKHLNTNAR